MSPRRQSSALLVACRVGKGAGTSFPCREASRAPCPPRTAQLASMPLVGTAHDGFLPCGKTPPAPLPTLQGHLSPLIPKDIRRQEREMAPGRKKPLTGDD